MLENVKDAPGRVTGWIGTSRKFVQEVRNELSRVTWPTRKEVYATTFVVVLTWIFFGIYLWGLDLIFDRIVGWIFRTFGVA
jgi:preprotein translocase subunit SecE